MRRLQRVTVMAALGAIVVALVGCSAGGQGRQEATPTPIPTPIVPTKPTYTVQRGEVVKKVDFTGRIAPVVEKELFFRSSGYVGAVYVKRDAVVKEGDLLAELEVTDLKNQLAQAEAALAATIASNEQAIADAEFNLQMAELNLAQTKASDPSADVTAATIGLERAQHYLAYTKEELQKTKDRYWEIDRDRLIRDAERVVFEAEQEVQLAEARLQQARQGVATHQYNIQIQELQVEQARRHLEQLKAGVQVEEMRLNVERLKALLQDAQILAPFDGIVLSISLVEGRAVEGYRPVIIVADPSELEVSADVPDRVLATLTEGMPAVAAPVSSPGDEIPAQIRRLPYPYGGGGRTAGVGEEDKSTRVSIDMEAAGNLFKLGDLVRVTVVLERKQDVLWLPPQAIRTFEGRRFVVVQEEGGQRRVDVKVGIQGEDRVEILEGLTEGQVVVGP